MRFDKTEVWGFKHAIRGVRNPKESWNRSDSYELNGDFVIGQADMELAQTLIRAGTEHRKFLRQIFVSVDITAPLYWWKEFDTYKVGTVANSTSTMHKIASKPITTDCFEIDDYDNSLQLINPINIGISVNKFIDDLEQLRQLHLQFLKASKLPSSSINVNVGSGANAFASVLLRK